MSDKSLSNSNIDKLIEEARQIASSGDYRSHEPTARNHAALQAKIIEVNGELIKTIRKLDEKNSKLQILVFWLAVVSTFAGLVALFK
jgi:hypothetical protein